jgi:hypothetical protein
MRAREAKRRDGRHYKSRMHLLLPRAANSLSTGGIVARCGEVRNISVGIAGRRVGLTDRVNEKALGHSAGLGVRSDACVDRPVKFSHPRYSRGEHRPDDAFPACSI